MAVLKFGGGTDGIKEYLENGKKQGRVQSRDEIDQRIILDGDLEVTDKIIQSMQTDGEKYDHITLSFKEGEISEEMLRAISADFKAFALAAYEPDEINFFAEAHIPKTETEEKWNAVTRQYETVARKPHIHFVIPKVNLVTGGRASPFELVAAKYATKNSTLDFVDAFKEHINTKYGLASPLDNRRSDFTGDSEILSRVKGDDFTGRNRASLKMIRDKMLEQKIESVAAFKAMLGDMGEVSIGHGKDGDYFQVRLHGQAQNVRLKNFQFSEKFIALPISEKLAFLEHSGMQATERDRAAENQTREALLAGWSDRAREIKYLSPSSKFFKELYAKACPDEKRFVLDRLELEHYNKLKKEPGYERPTSSEMDRQIAGRLERHDHVRTGRMAVSDIVSRNLRESARNFEAFETHPVLDANAIRERADGLAANAFAHQLAGIVRGGSGGIDHGGIGSTQDGGINHADRPTDSFLAVKRNLLAAEENYHFSEGLGADFWEAAIARRASLDNDVTSARYEALSNGKLNSIYLRTTDELRVADKAGQDIIEDPSAVINALTFSQSFFTDAELERYLLKNTADPEQFELALRGVMHCPDLVVQQSDDGIRLTSTEIVAIEQRLIARTERMAATRLRAVTGRQQQKIIKAKTFNDGQCESFKLLCSDKQIVVINGAAGTGKSFALAAMREAYEAEGFTLHGAILQGKTAEDLERDSGIKSQTIARFVTGLEMGFEKLNAKSVVVVDEAGMVGSRDLEKLLAFVESAGARIRLVGDAKQLAAVEYGRAFVEISARCKVGSLTEIMRQRVKWQREASELFARHDISALRAYHDHGHVHFEDSAKDAMISLVEKWNSHRANHPDQSSIVLAHTNAERIELNEMMRAEIKKQGGLQGGTDVLTKRGIVKMSVGERVMFTRGDKEMGVKNGTTGTVSAINKDGSISVTLESGKVAKFYADGRKTESGNEIDYAYAVTVHKSQGMTLDKAFVLANSGMSLENLYVAMTRHKHSVELVASAEQFSDIEAMLVGLDRAGRKEFTANKDGQKWLGTKRVCDSVIGQYIAEMNAERVIQLAAKQASYKEICANLDAQRVLDYVSKTHGIQLENHSVVTGDDGSQRIQTGNSSLDVVGFLTLKMHLDYKTEAEPILKQCYAEQLANVYTSPRRMVGEQIEQEIRNEFAEYLKDRDSTYKAEKNALDNQNRTAKARIEAPGVTDDERKLALAELDKNIKAKKAALKTVHVKRKDDVYKDFLAERAGGDEKYLQEFWRVAVTTQDKERLAGIEKSRAVERDPVPASIDISHVVATVAAEDKQAVENEGLHLTIKPADLERGNYIGTVHSIEPEAVFIEIRKGDLCKLPMHEAFKQMLAGEKFQIQYKNGKPNVKIWPQKSKNLSQTR